MIKKTYTIEKAWKMNDKGFDVQDGWDLFCDGNWCQRFYLKRDAKAAMLEAAKEEGLVQDRKTGVWYNPKEAFDALMNTPEVLKVLNALSVK